MNTDLILTNLLSPPVLFFVGGLLAVAVRSDLEIPPEIARFLSLFLLFSLGIKGGRELAHSPGGLDVWLPLVVAVLLSLIVPLYTFWFLKKRLDTYNAGAIAATYGSVSAVTFVTAVSFLEGAGVPFGGHMVAALAIMESPAIVIGVLLINSQRKRESSSSLRKVVREAFTNGSVFVILLSLVVGLVISEAQYEDVRPFSDGLFKGMLSLFMLDMGLLAGSRLGGLRSRGLLFTLFGLVVPLINAALTILVCPWLGISLGNAFLLTILAASASYIAVPAAMRMAVPQSNPGIFVPMSLGITFPLNIILGIPLYYTLLEQLY